jgi:hypothetical protein
MLSKSCLGPEKDWLFDDKSAIIPIVSEKTGKEGMLKNEDWSGWRWK